MARKQKPGIPADRPKWERVTDLFLDPKNPRLVGRDLSLEDQAGILEVLWKERAVNEIVDSIVASGRYWDHEVMFATVEQGKLVVVEGNRRLAGVKVLTDAELRSRAGVKGVPRISSAFKQRLQKLPVLRSTREEIWQYVGFKHVNGPQDWDSIAKAEYIARVYNDFGVRLEDIASTIGDRHETVKRLYRGLMVLKQAEREGVFDREDSWAPRFYYSHLMTGLGYAGILRFLGFTASSGYKPDPVPRAKLGNLRELLAWLYGSKERDERPRIRSQNPDLRNLDEILRSEKGVSFLRAGLPLSTALDASRGDKRLLQDAMALAQENLRKAKGLVPTGYEGERDLLSTAETVHVLAGSIHEEMASRPTTGAKRTRGKKGEK